MLKPTEQINKHTACFIWRWKSGTLMKCGIDNA